MAHSKYRKNFVLGVIVGIVIAFCAYKLYQIEMEYRQNIATGLETQVPVHCFTGSIRND